MITGSELQWSEAPDVHEVEIISHEYVKLSFWH